MIQHVFEHVACIRSTVQRSPESKGIIYTWLAIDLASCHSQETYTNRYA